MRSALAALTLWGLCVATGALFRYIFVAQLNVWTPDGRLNVEPWVFTCISVIPLLVAGGSYIWFVTPREGPE